MKRKLESSDTQGGEDHSFHAASVLTALRIEYKRVKRDLHEAIIELEMNKKKIGSMEDYVGGVQRAWSQLDADTSLILNIITGEEININNKDMLDKYLSCCDTNVSISHRLSDPSLRFDIDKWSSPQEIESERLRIKSAIQQIESAAPSSSVSNEILREVSFTKNIIERIVSKLINTPSLSSSANVILERMTSIREHFSEHQKLMCHIVSLRSDLACMEARYLTKSHQLERLERLVDGNDIKITRNGHTNGLTHQSSPSHDHPSIDAAADIPSRIPQQESLVSSSENVQTATESAIITSESAPTVIISDESKRLREVIGELRNRYRTKLQAFQDEFAHSHGKVIDLEWALSTFEKESAAKVSEVSIAAEGELKTLREDQAKLRFCLATAQSDQELLVDIRTKLDDLSLLEAAAREAASSAQSQLKQAAAKILMLETHLTSSRERERAIEERYSNESSGYAEEASLVHARHRSLECEAELQSAQASMNDLICEIESVATAEASARTQSASLLQRWTEAQASHRSMREENLRLLEQISALQQKYNAMQSRVAVDEEEGLRQQSIISTMRNSEAELRVALSMEKRCNVEMRIRLESSEDCVSQLRQQAEDLDRDKSYMSETLSKLQAKCSDLSSELELQRDRNNYKECDTKSSKEKLNGVRTGGLNSDDASMLEMTLSMLRCSICKDRFKNVALTRCYHLFCSECIDETIRNRSRKCPACGDKFGHDDVKSIFFTH